MRQFHQLRTALFLALGTASLVGCGKQPEADSSVDSSAGTPAEVRGTIEFEVLVLHFKQANSCVLRVQGFQDEIAEYNASHEDERIEIVVELEGGGLRDEGFRATADALQSHPRIAGIFAINDPSALGAWTALQQVDRQEDVVIVGFDGQLEGKQAIRDGKIYADPIQFPRQMGRVTVENIVKYLDGEDFEEMQLIPTELYRQADAEQDPELSGEPPAADSSADSSAGTSGDVRGTIGFSALTLQNPFFKTIADAMTSEADEHGFVVLVNDADRDVNEQAKHIDNYIAQQVSAIVINPADRVAIGPAIRKANDAGIPVFTCDLQCVAEEAEIAGHIGTDNYQGGRLAGVAMIEALTRP